MEEYIQRMADSRLPKKNLNYKPEGRRDKEDYKRDGEMISGSKEHAKERKPYR